MELFLWRRKKEILWNGNTTTRVCGEQRIPQVSNQKVVGRTSLLEVLTKQRVVKERSRHYFACLHLVNTHTPQQHLANSICTHFLPTLFHFHFLSLALSTLTKCPWLHLAHVSLWMLVDFSFSSTSLQVLLILFKLLSGTKPSELSHFYPLSLSLSLILETVSASLTG